jgi:hypothetical protein
MVYFQIKERRQEFLVEWPTIGKMKVILCERMTFCTEVIASGNFELSCHVGEK